ncbi:hypothetical protein, partial [Pseudonocardia sp. ICBG601]|uniref:hypothetical protein n=1 Tax=Pseudonocardia sp. ICBG601 TaxID=2846759 RepID=UPI0027E27681
MMRVCHLDTCPVGVADARTRSCARSSHGKAEYVRELHAVRGAGGPRDPRRAGLPLARRGDRPGR